MPDGMTGKPPEPLRIVQSGVKYGVAADGMVAWLPPRLWAPAAELKRELERLEKEVARVNQIIDAAQAEADAAGGVQTPWNGPG